MNEFTKVENAIEGEPYPIPVPTQADKDSFLARAAGIPCKSCEADKPIGTGQLCEICRDITVTAKAELDLVFANWPENDAGFDKLTERIRRHYREDIATRKARVLEARE